MSLKEEELFRNLEEKTFELNFPQISLYDAEDRDTLVASGTGFARMDSAGYIRISAAVPMAPWMIAAQSATVKRRSLIYFRATDAAGDEWVSAEVEYVRTLYPAVGRAEVIGKPEKLIRLRKSTGSPQRIQLAFSNPPPLPFELVTQHQATADGKPLWTRQSLNRQIVETSDLKICFQTENAILTVDVYPSHDGLSLFADTNVLHALMYVTARNARPAYIYEARPDRETLCVTSPVTAAWDSHFFPPVTPHSQADFAAFWSVFATYLDYLRRQESPEWHPFTVETSKAVTASNIGLEAFVLTLGVSIEAMLKVAAPDPITDEAQSSEIPPEDSELTEIENLLVYLHQWGGNERIRKRTVGAVEAFRKTRAKDLLYALESKRVISDVHIMAWDRLRHAAAHGKVFYSDNDHEQLTADVATVTGLFHRIILHRIGHRGSFTDYTRPGYPLTRFQE